MLAESGISALAFANRSFRPRLCENAISENPSGKLPPIYHTLRLENGVDCMGDLQLIGKGRLAEVFAWGDTQVLKLFAAGRDAAAIEAEARVSQIVHEAGVVTPGTHGVVEVEGRRGIVYDRALGTSMLGQLSAKPWRLFAFGRMLAELHVSVHQCRVDQYRAVVDL